MQREAEGITVDRATWQQIRAAARTVGMPQAQVERWSQYLQ